MSKTDDLLKRAAEEFIKSHDKQIMYGNKPQGREAKAFGIIKAQSILIQELSDKIKGDAYRVDSGKLQKEVSLAISLAKHKLSSYYEFADDEKKQEIIEDYASRQGNMNAAQAAINVIKGDDDDR